MKSPDVFKEFMAGSKAPNYVRRYCEGLDEFKWQWFYFPDEGTHRVCC